MRCGRELAETGTNPIAIGCGFPEKFKFVKTSLVIVRLILVNILLKHKFMVRPTKPKSEHHGSGRSHAHMGKAVQRVS